MCGLDMLGMRDPCREVCLSRRGGLAKAPAHPLPNCPPPSEEEMAEELGEVKSMWEMAAILDYLTLFK